MVKVGIIGIGNVGATIALNAVQTDLIDELLLIDMNQGKAQSEAIDIMDAASLLNFHTKVKVGNYSDLGDADVVISALGNIALIEENGDRFAELRANIPVVKAVSKDLKESGFIGKLIVTTNPNDVIVDLYQKETGFDRSKVMGTGTYLDTARMKRQVSEALDVDPRTISGYVLGEHGNSQFVAWSTVKVAGTPILEINKEKNLDLDALEEAARQGGFAVHAGKGYTNVAIAAATVGLMTFVLTDAKESAICSHYDEDFESYISTPAIIGAKGVEGVVSIDLSESEKEKLAASVAEIQEKINEFS